MNLKNSDIVKNQKEKKENNIIFSALPYAHGDLHCGRILGAALPADCLKRFYRLKNKKVVHYSGSDMYGELISLSAYKLKKNPKELALEHHKNFKKIFSFLNITFDKYVITTSKTHSNFVNNYFDKYLEPFLEKSDNYNFFCESCKEYLNMRKVFTNCFFCKKNISDDVCEICWNHFEISQNSLAKCKTCLNETTVKKAFNLRFPLNFKNSQKKKIVNSVEMRYKSQLFPEGIMNGREILRYTDYGVSWHNSKILNTKIYVWIEALLAYLEAEGLTNIKKGISKRFFFLGKDNFHFHAEILHKLYFLLFKKFPVKFHSKLFVRNFVNIRNKKISSSKSCGDIFKIKDLISKSLPSDSIRLYLIGIDTLEKDSNYSYEKLINHHNTIYCNKLINLFHRLKNLNTKPIKLKQTKKLNRIIKILDFNLENSKLSKVYRLLISISDDINTQLDRYIMTKNNKTLNSALNVLLNTVDYFEIILPNFFENVKKKLIKKNGLVFFQNKNFLNFKKIFIQL